MGPPSKPHAYLEDFAPADQTAGRILAPFAQIASLITRYYQTLQALRGVDNIMQKPVERPPGKSFVHRPSFRGEIEPIKATL